MKILTQNCFGIPFPGTASRLYKIASKIFEISPDVAFLQEIQWKKNVGIFKNPEYEIFYEMGLYGTKGGLLTMVRKSFFGKQVFVKFEQQGGWRQIGDRGLGKGILDVFVPKENIHLINTHLLATYSPGFLRDRDQLKQLQQLLRYVGRFNKFVGGGDLNFPEGSLYYDKLTSEVDDYTFEMGISHPILKSKIDFVFGKGIKKVIKKEFVTFGSFVSDHKGILVELKV